MTYPGKGESELASGLYAPIQPAVEASQNDIMYRESKPSANLQDQIYCYWHLKTNFTLAQPFVYRIVADGCVDIYFSLQDIDNSFAMGFYKSYTEFDLGCSFDFIGIRFYPAGFPQLFDIPAKELSDGNYELDQVLPWLANSFRTQISPYHDFTEITHKLDQLLIQIRSQKALHFDHRFYEALHLILKQRGVIETENELNTGLSSRQLRRLFDHYIGTSPKFFSKVVRFQSILHAKPSHHSLRKSKLFFDAGFYDQAHFIKDFKKLYGMTPSAAFR